MAANRHHRGADRASLPLQHVRSGYINSKYRNFQANKNTNRQYFISQIEMFQNILSELQAEWEVML